MSKVLYDVFQEAGPIYNVFLPEGKLSGRGRRFGFVRFKTEWDANRAIQKLYGRLIGGRRIGVQKEKYLDRSNKSSSRHFSQAVKRKTNLKFTMLHQGRGLVSHPSTPDLAWIEQEGNNKVVKIAASLALSFQKEVFSSFVVTVH